MLAAGSPGTGATPVSISATPTPLPVRVAAVPVAAPISVRTCRSVVAVSVLDAPSQLGLPAAALAGATPVTAEATRPAATTAIPARLLLLVIETPHLFRLATGQSHR